MKRISAAVTAGAILLCLLCSCETDKYTANGFAMDTTLSVTTYGADKTDAVLREISSLEAVISATVSGSETARINSNPGTAVNAPAVASVLHAVSELCSDTGGEMTAAVLPLTRLWNVTSESPRVPSEPEIKAALELCGDGKISVNGDNVTLLCDGAGIDIGAFGKGLALDKCAELLGGTKAVVSLGGSVLLNGAKQGGWRVAVSVPGDRNTALGILTLDGNSYISTSGSRERFFTENGKDYHHIISAVTGFPSDTGLLSVTVVCENGLMSDALSTACFLTGRDKGLELLKKYGAEGVFVSEAGEVTVTGGLYDRFELKADGYRLSEAQL